jgi:hypothetical protein
MSYPLLKWPMPIGDFASGRLDLAGCRPSGNKERNGDSCHSQNTVAVERGRQLATDAEQCIFFAARRFAYLLVVEWLTPRTSTLRCSCVE